jgi:hypothetical protein
MLQINSSEFVQYMTFNFKILLMIFATCIVWSVLVSSINSIKLAITGGEVVYEPVRLNGMNCRSVETFKSVSKDQENFSNDDMYSYKKSVSSSYQSIPLTAKDDDNLFFGKANRFIMVENDPVFSGKSKIVFRLEIFCNLFVLDGNVFNQRKNKQAYGVYLVNSKTGDQMFINNLKKDNDGIYKLKYKTSEDVEKLASYDQINIIYSLDEAEQLILYGKLN